MVSNESLIFNEIDQKYFDDLESLLNSNTSLYDEDSITLIKNVINIREKIKAGNNDRWLFELIGRIVSKHSENKVHFLFNAFGDFDLIIRYINTQTESGEIGRGREALYHLLTYCVAHKLPEKINFLLDGKYSFLLEDDDKKYFYKKANIYAGKLGDVNFSDNDEDVLLFLEYITKKKVSLLAEESLFDTLDRACEKYSILDIMANPRSLIAYLTLAYLLLVKKVDEGLSEKVKKHYEKILAQYNFLSRLKHGLFSPELMGETKQLISKIRILNNLKRTELVEEYLDELLKLDRENIYIAYMSTPLETESMRTIAFRKLLEEYRDVPNVGDFGTHGRSYKSLHDLLDGQSVETALDYFYMAFMQRDYLLALDIIEYLMKYEVADHHRVNLVMLKAQSLENLGEHRKVLDLIGDLFSENILNEIEKSSFERLRVRSLYALGQLAEDPVVKLSSDNQQRVNFE